MRLIRKLGLAALTTALATPAQAQGEAPLEVASYVRLEKVTTTASGERQVEWVEPEVVVPGDKLIFGTRFANTGDTAIERFVVSNPVPPSVSVSGEIDPAMLVSVDGGTTWGRLAEIEVTQSDGMRRAALPGDVTNVRWVLSPITPGQTGALEFPVTVR